MGKPFTRNILKFLRSYSLMTRHASVRGALFVLVLMLSARGRAAQESALPDSLATHVVPTSMDAPSSASAAKIPERLKLSLMLASRIASTLQVWSPTLVKPAEKPPPADPEIVAMAPMIVWGNRLPRIDEMEWLSPAALDAVLVKKYMAPFACLLNPSGLSAGLARIMYEEDKRLQNLKWINEQIDELKLLDTEEAKALQRARNSIFTRKPP
jgi:hypothetical protein